MRNKKQRRLESFRCTNATCALHNIVLAGWLLLQQRHHHQRMKKKNRIIAQYCLVRISCFAFYYLHVHKIRSAKVCARVCVCANSAALHSQCGLIRKTHKLPTTNYPNVDLLNATSLSTRTCRFPAALTNLITINFICCSRRNNFLYLNISFSFRFSNRIRVSFSSSLCIC